MADGKVKFFNSSKGYGFVAPTDGSPDVFLHMTELRKAGMDRINEGQTITYDVAPGREGKPKAVNIAVK